MSDREINRCRVITNESGRWAVLFEEGDVYFATDILSDEKNNLWVARIVDAFNVSAGIDAVGPICAEGLVKE